MQRFLIALLLILMAVPATAATQGQYLDVNNFPLQMLAAPPAEGSPKWKQEVKDVLNAQRLTNADDLTAMRSEVRLNPADFATMAGISTPPLTTGLLNRVADDVHGITSNAKRYWNTRRPYVADKRVKLQVPKLDNNAYPSGHASFAYTLAGVLGQLYPGKQTVLQEKAGEMIWRRVQAGVHYPADLEGGKTLAVAILGALNENANYRADLRAAEAEIAGRLHAPTAAVTPAQPVAVQPAQSQLTKSAAIKPSAPPSPVAQAVQAQLARSMNSTQPVMQSSQTAPGYYYADANQPPQTQQQVQNVLAGAPPTPPPQTYEVPYQRTVQQFPTVDPRTVQLARQPGQPAATLPLREPPPFPQDFWLKSRSLYFAE